MKEQSDIEFESLLGSVVVSPEEKSQLELIGEKMRIRIASVFERDDSIMNRDELRDK